MALAGSPDDMGLKSSRACRRNWVHLIFKIRTRGVIMAGETNASIVPCLRCAGAAHRTAEGQEDDQYKCSECGTFC